MSAIALPLPPPGVEWITLGQAAARLGVSRNCVRKLIADRRLSERRIATWRRVPAHEVAALAEAATTPAIAD